MTSLEQIHDRDLALQEISHRFFNSLQVIDSLLSGALRDGDDEAARRESFQAIRRRIRIMSQLHRRVARTYSFGDLLESHCREVCLDLVRCFGREDVTPWVEVSDVTLPLAREQRLVLLMVELVTNALKHSRSDGYGVIWVDLKPCGVDHLELRVRDNGVSTSDHGPVGRPRIADALARELGGSLSVSTEAGFSVKVRFPILRPDSRRHDQADANAKACDAGWLDALI